MTKVVKNIIPYNKYFIDSAKFFVDSDKFQEHRIPNKFILVDSETGETLDEFKRSSLQIEYKNHKIYIANIVRHLKQMSIDKVLIYFSSKVAGDDYFGGIKKHHLIEVLEFIKEKGYLKFESANEIYKHIYVKDLDIKFDYKLKKSDKDELREHQLNLKDRFNGHDDYFHIFDSIKQGFGIATYSREKGTYAKPFLKFYDKSMELLTVAKNFELVKAFSYELQQEIRNNFIYRYEFTIRDKKHFDKFEISNRLEEIHEVINEKWSEVGREFLNQNFQTKIRKPRNINMLNLKERIMCLQVFMDIQDGMSAHGVRNKYLVVAETRRERFNVNLLFDRIYFFAGNDNNKETVKNYARFKGDIVFEKIKKANQDNAKKLITFEKWDAFFGFEPEPKEQDDEL